MTTKTSTFTRLLYEDIIIHEFNSNRAKSVDAVLEWIDFDVQAFCNEHGFDAIDYGDFKFVTVRGEV